MDLARTDAPATHIAGAPEAPGEKPGGTAVERWALVAIVLAMVLLPTLEAAVRRLTGAGVPGAAVYTEHLTLWVGFIGALLATATGHHLALSTVDLLPERLRPWARAYGSAITTLVCAVLAYASLDMVLADKGRVDTLAGGVPEWWFEIIMPVGFAVMSWRGAKMAPFRKARIFCLAILIVVLAFVVSRIFYGRGAGLVMPDAGRVLRAVSTWPGAILL
ncbi:MAG: TRAP transporter small permease, partial [Myxococcales bacterium]